MREADQPLALEVARRFLPDDAATPEDLADIRAARAEYASGQTVAHGEINWD